jgi:hypothetical protein
MYVLAAHPHLAGYLSGQVPARRQIRYGQTLALGRKLHGVASSPYLESAHTLHPDTRRVSRLYGDLSTISSISRQPNTHAPAGGGAKRGTRSAKTPLASKTNKEPMML